MIIDNQVESHSARDTKTLIKVGLHISTIICADHISNPVVPRNMTNFTNSEMRMNQAFCKVYSGRLLQYNAVVKPARHSITWVDVRSPIMEFIFDEVHRKMHCGLGSQSYINGINLAGFCATGLNTYVQEQIDACSSCAEAKMILKGASALTKNMKQFYDRLLWKHNTSTSNENKIH